MTLCLRFSLCPRTKGKHALIICPNGHFGQGRYRKDQQQRRATLARMGAVCVDYDLYGWGESALQVGGKAHHTASDAHTIQAMNGNGYWTICWQTVKI